MAIHRRFRQLEISAFSGGEGQQFFEYDQKFMSSDNVNISERHASVGVSLSPFNSEQNNKHTDRIPFGVVWYKNNYFRLYRDQSDSYRVKLMESPTGYDDWSPTYDFGVNQALGCVFTMRGYLYVSFGQYSTTAYGKLYRSSSPGSSWSQITGDTIPLGYSTGVKIVRGDKNKLYFIGERAITSTMDGLAFDVEIAHSYIWFSSAVYHRGFLYVYEFFSNTLYRLDKGKLTFIRSFTSEIEAQVCIVGDDLCVVTRSNMVIHFNLFDGDQWAYLGHIVNKIYLAVTVLGYVDNKLYLAFASSKSSTNILLRRHIVTFDPKANFVHEYDLGVNADVFQVVRSSYDELIFFGDSWTSNTQKGASYYHLGANHNDYYSSAEIVSSMFDVGDHIPVACYIQFFSDLGITKTVNETHPFNSANIRVKTVWDGEVDAGAEWQQIFDVADLTYAKSMDYPVGNRYPRKFTDVLFKYPEKDKFVHNRVFFNIVLEVDTINHITPYIKKLIYLYKPVGLLDSK